MVLNHPFAFVAFSWFLGWAGFAGAGEATIGLYKSLDHGATWERVGEGISKNININSIVITPAVALAGTDDGLYSSRDAGAHWTKAGGGLPPAIRIRCIVEFHGDFLLGTSNRGIYRSKDSGKSWLPMNDRLTDLNVFALTVQGTSLYVGTDRGGVFVLGKGEETWRPTREGFPESAQVSDLVTIGDAVFAALYAKGLYRLDTKTRVWARAGEVRPWRLVTDGKVLLVGHNPGGVFRSEDSGHRWEEASAGLLGDAPVWTFAHDDGKFFVGAGQEGLYVSVDGGRTWSRSAEGLPKISGTACLAVSKGYILAVVISPK
jgi:photosystem II stability/assembly factor-like uncharacterized protein